MISFSWGIWLAIGLVMMGIEIIMPGFIIFWFGVGGIITAILVKTGILNNPVLQWLIFFGSSLAFLAGWFLYFKRFLKKKDPSDVRDPTLLNLRGRVVNRIAPGAPGRVELNEPYHSIKIWKAESVTVIEAGENIEVTDSKGINLVVKKI